VLKLETTEKVKKGISRLVSRVYAREVIFVWERKLNGAGFHVNNDEGTAFKVVQPEEFGKFADDFNKYGYCPEMVFRKANFFVAGMFNGEITHWELVTFANEIHAMELERSFRLPPNSAYVYSGYTPPKFRGKGWATKVLEKTYNYLAEKGIREAYSLVRANNIPQTKIMKKTHCQKIGEIRFTKMFNLKVFKLEFQKNEGREKLSQMFS
jgi:ribosomal protein S18 acetylase RimI-like enzyme